MSVNLSGRPFLNRKPVRRVALLMWLVGTLLLAVNGFLYWRYFSGQGETQTNLVGVAAELELEDERLEAATDELVGFEVAAFNDQVEFVNSRIRERTFSWSGLFDRVAEILPPDVRLTSLTPKFERDQISRRSRRRRRPEGVVLDVTGHAQSGEALLELVDQLFGHAAFVSPDLQREATAENGLIGFSVSVIYVPGAESKVSGAAEPAAAADSADSADSAEGGAS